MNNLAKLLQDEQAILLDGAMGTMLMSMGLEHGRAPEMWNLEYPKKVRMVHQQYIQAGARIVLTNSFGGNKLRLKLHGLDDRVPDFNYAAASLARLEADAAPHLVVVGGSMGPVGEMIEPLGLATFEEVQEAFAEQAAALAQGGAEVLWIETMGDLTEARAAVEGTRQVTDLPIVVTMTFDTRGYTMMGVSPAQALETLGGMGLQALGANCGNGPAEIEGVIRAMQELEPKTALVAKSNAGVPQWVGGELVYDGTPEVMADHAVRVRSLGAQLIGTCCGSTPAHTCAMAAALGLPIPMLS